MRVLNWSEKASVSSIVRTAAAKADKHLYFCEKWFRHRIVSRFRIVRQFKERKKSKVAEGRGRMSGAEYGGSVDGMWGVWRGWSHL